MKNKNNKPEWVPENASDEHFTSFVMKGVDSVHDGLGGDTAMDFSFRNLKKRKTLSLDDYKNGVLNCDINILARAITLIESNVHIDMAQSLIKEILPNTGKSLRIGITGVPGAGKSTFIEAFGSYLVGLGKKVAVLAVDPSSTLSGGSILGDKTRMENLSRLENAFIRPSPSGGALGGVARKSRETMLLCEAAGYEIILIETVGVGQSEVTVRSMSDFFLLIQLAAQGDDLQGIKKGVIELADGILVNKCDGNMVEKSMMKVAELRGVFHYIQSPTEGWTPFCDSCSALENKGIDNAWNLICGFFDNVKNSGVFDERRHLQRQEWFKSVLSEEIFRKFYSNEKVKFLYEQLLHEIKNSDTPVTLAVQRLLKESEK